MIHIYSSGSVGEIWENSSATVNDMERHGTTPTAVTLLAQSRCVYKYIEQWYTYAHWTGDVLRWWAGTIHVFGKWLGARGHQAITRAHAYQSHMSPSAKEGNFMRDTIAINRLHWLETDLYIKIRSSFPGPVCWCERCRGMPMIFHWQSVNAIHAGTNGRRFADDIFKEWKLYKFRFNFIEVVPKR